MKIYSTAPAALNQQAAEAARIKKHSVQIHGHKTSISMEAIFWERLKVIAKRRKCTLSELATTIDTERAGNRSSAMRVFVLKDALSPGETRGLTNQPRRSRDRRASSAA